MAHVAFVYGTLKSDQRNHKVMLNSENGVAKYLGHAHTVKRFPLVVLTPYKVPFLLYKEDMGKIVQGELYEIDDAMLASLDKFENHPHVYERTEVKVVHVHDEQTQTGTERDCYAYFLKLFRANILELPSYECFNGLDEHALHSEHSDHTFEDVRNAVRKDVMPETPE